MLGMKDVSRRGSRTGLEAQEWLARSHRENYHSAERQVLWEEGGWVDGKEF